MKKVAPKGETTNYGAAQGLPDSPPRARTFLNNKQQLSKQWTTTIAEIVKVAKQMHKMLQQNRKNVKVALQT